MSEEWVDTILVMAASVVILGAYFLDPWLGTRPWLMLISLGGFGIVLLFRVVNRH
jgi:F0F1-type ATP synthase assembly protein I